MTQAFLALPLALLATTLSQASTQRAIRPPRLVTRETSLGKIDPGIVRGSLVVSPDSQHVGYLIRQGDG